MLWRIDMIHAAAQHGDRSGLQTRRMRLAVNAQREAGDD